MTRRELRTQSAGDVMALTALGLLVLKLAWGIGRVRDLPGMDEPRYETGGLHLFAALRGTVDGTATLPTADWGPGYSLAYALESLAWPERITLFDFHWGLLIALVCAGLYVLARRAGLAQPVALFVGAVFLATNFVHMQPFVSHFYLLELMAGCLVATRCREGHVSLAVAAAAFGVAAFARPEAAPVALVLGGFVLYGAPAAWRRVGAVRTFARLGIAAGPPLALGAIFGNPLGGHRAFDAFSQHYAFNVARREHLADSPWVNFSRITARDFGDASTVREAIARNPAAFLRHVLTNVVELPSNVLDLCSLRASVVHPPGPALQAVGAVFIVAAALLCFSTLWAVAREAGWRAPVAPPSPLRIVALFFVASCAAALPGLLLVFPRAHYLVAPCGFALVLAACGLTRIARRMSGRGPVTRTTFVAIAIVAAGLACVVPSSAAARADAVPEPNRNCELALEAMKLPPVHVLELEIGFAAIAGYDYPTWTGWEKSGPLLTYLSDRDIGLIVVWEPFLERAAYADDPESRDFFSAPERYGWRVAYTDPGSFRVLVRGDHPTSTPSKPE